MSLVHSQSRPDINLHHAQFLEILPKIELHARWSFRHVRCRQTQEDYISETTAICWKWFLRLVEQGKDPTQFPTILAGYATRAVRSGRRTCGQENSKDVLSRIAQGRYSFVVSKFPDRSTLESNPLGAALVDNTQSPIPEQVHFRLDFPSWLRSLNRKRRRISKAMILGHRTLDLAARFRISPGRISQLRRELRHSWRQFIKEATPSFQPNLAA
jgi:hypothetical protein